MIRNKDIQREIEEMAPTLAAIPLSKIYEVPEGYFENIDIIVSEQLGAQNSYAVPEGYFEKMQEEVLEKVNPPTKVRSIFTMRNIMGIAASLTLLISAMVWMQNDVDTTTEIVTTESIAEYSDGEDYILDHLEDFDIEDLFEEGDALTIEDMESDILMEFVEDNLMDYDIDQIEGLL